MDKVSRLSAGMVVLGAPAWASAAFLTLVPSADLSAFEIGQTVSVDVVLSGLEAGTRLELLSATVGFPATSFQIPLSITRGAVVPQPLADPLDFLTIRDSGIADISFQTNSPLAEKQITTNGVFASVLLRASAIGPGEIAFTFTSAFAFNPGSPNEPTEVVIEAGPALRFDVVVPEPSLSIPGALVVCLGLARRRRAASN